MSPRDGSPFDRNHADPWTKRLVDVEDLNANASDAIVRAITMVRERARDREADLRTTSLLVLGAPGAGKTHLFARLRHKVGPRAVFVHIRPLLGAEMTPRYVLGEITKQLAYVNAGLRQLDALSVAALAHLEGESPDMPRAHLEALKALDAGARQAKVDSAIEQILERHPGVDEAYLTRLLHAPSLEKADLRAALAWLSGGDLEESQRARLGVQSDLAAERVIPALDTLAVCAAPGAPIVLVFDQLENLVDSEGDGGERVRAYGNLVAELFDSVRGFVLVHLVLQTEWTSAFQRALPLPQRTRLAERTELLSLPTAAEKRELVRRWHEQLPDAERRPFPAPFDAQRIEAWATQEGLTPRMLMIACREVVEEGGGDGEAGVTDALAAAWDEHVAAARRTLDEAAVDRRGADLTRLTAGITAAARFVSGVEIVHSDARKPVQISLRTEKATWSLCLAGHPHPTSVLAAFRKAVEARARGRVVVLREQALPIPGTWKAVLAAQADLRARGISWHALDRDEVVAYVALESFLAAARSRDLEDARGVPIEAAEVEAWVRSTREIALEPLFQPMIEGDGPGAESPSAGPVGPMRTPDPPVVTVVTAAAPPPDDVQETVLAVMTALRIASLERVVREVSRVKSGVTGAAVTEAADALVPRVRWFGRAVLAIGAAR